MVEGSHPQSVSQMGNPRIHLESYMEYALNAGGLTAKSMEPTLKYNE
jgi:hypothetical protein